MGVTREVMKLNATGMTPFQIRADVDAKYIDLIDNATPTPYPPQS
jgi:hypothetical protein